MQTLSLLIILLALGVEMTLPAMAQFRGGDWARRWYRWAARRCPRAVWLERPWTLWVIIGSPLLLVLATIRLLGGVSPVLEFAGALTILLLSLGPRSLDLEVAAYLHTYAAHEPVPDAIPPITLVQDVDHGEEDLDTALAVAIGTAAHDRIFAPLFWFALLGPSGGVLYRLVAELRQERSMPEQHARLLQLLAEGLTWLPARLWILGLGLAGSLPPVLNSLREPGSWSLPRSREVLRNAILAAIQYGRLDQLLRHDPHVYWVNTTYSLTRRALALWLAAIVLWIFASALV